MIHLKSLTIASFFLFSFSMIPAIDASDKYYIGKDNGGIYFETDGHGSWYVDKSDAKNFRIGETGKFKFGTDEYGTYIVTDRQLKFYVKTEPSITPPANRTHTVEITATSIPVKKPMSR